jgi:hypothetical protein
MNGTYMVEEKMRHISYHDKQEAKTMRICVVTSLRKQTWLATITKFDIHTLTHNQISVSVPLPFKVLPSPSHG